MKKTLIYSMVASFLAVGAQAETITFTTVDFRLPSDIRAAIPKSVKASDIFVSSENCYYVRTSDLHFAFIACIG